MTITEMAQRISQLERALEIEFGAHSFALLVSKSYTNTPLVLS